MFPRYMSYSVSVSLSVRLFLSFTWPAPPKASPDAWVGFLLCLKYQHAHAILLAPPALGVHWLVEAFTNLESILCSYWLGLF